MAPKRSSRVVSLSRKAAAARSRLTSGEWEARVDLAAAYRLVAQLGWDDLIFSHISMRVPDEPHFLINPYGWLFEEITASSLVKIDVEGNKVEDSRHMVSPDAIVLHGAIHAAREDAKCVIHLHTVHGQAVAAHRDGLLPLTQTAMIVAADTAHHDFEGISTDLEERRRLIEDLSDCHAMILRNHGTLSVGETVADAFIRMYFLERACQTQVAALSGSGDLVVPAASAVERTVMLAKGGLTDVGRDLVWPALLRRLDRLDPGYRE